MTRLTSDPLDLVRDALLAAGCDPKGGQKISAKCPAHADSNPSLSVTRGTAQPVVLTCHAGCAPDAVLAALRLEWGDLCEGDDDSYERPVQRRVVATYLYVDEGGAALFEVVRFEPKDFRQRRPDGAWGLGGARRVLYRLPAVIDAVKNGQAVYVCEGEKDVHAVEAAGAVATCNPGGALKWRDEYDVHLAGANVVIVADDDGPGHAHANDVAGRLRKVATAVVIKLPIAGAKDVAQHLGMGHGLADLRPYEPLTTEGWEPPLPLGASNGAAGPVFPAHRLPPWLNAYVVDLAKSLQTPVDLPAMLVLAVLAAAAGGRATVEVRAGWIEPLNLYIAVAMPPGSRKTPVYQRVVKPLESAERDAAETARPEVNDARLQFNVAKAIADKAEADVPRASEAAREEAVNYAKAMRAMAEAVVVPVMPRLLADDATPEALATLMAQQAGRLAMFSDEGEVFSMMAGRYSTSGPNLAIYLKSHVGSPLRVDRKGRDPEFIQSPALTLGLTIQPSLLAAVASIEGARGRGLLGRFLWSVPPSNIGFRDIEPPAVDPAVEARYVGEVRQLVTTLEGWKAPDVAIIVFTPEANAVMRRFEAEIEERLRPYGDLHHIADWASKLAGHVARIAGLLHLATDPREGWGTALQADHVDDAVTIGHWLIAHALVAFDAMRHDPVLADAQLLARWLVGKTFVSKRDMQRAHMYRFPKATDIDPAVEVLESHGILKRDAPSAPSGPGRPGSTKYHVNPLNRDLNFP